MKIIVSLMLFSLCTAINAAGNMLTYEVNGKSYEGYFVSANNDAPLVLLIHDWDGLTDYEVQRANMLADLGYSVFAADLFGAGIRPTEVKDKRQHTGELYKDREKMRSLMQGALNAAKSKGANTNNAVAMGYCFGGASVLELARSGTNLKGFVSFHGGLTTPNGQSYNDTQGKVVVFHGTADSIITMQQFASLADELEQHEVPHEMITYSGAPHSFTVFNTEKYRKEADKQSWRRFTEFLAETLN